MMRPKLIDLAERAVVALERIADAHQSCPKVRGPKKTPPPDDEPITEMDRAAARRAARRLGLIVRDPPL
jgi:hypothetical protein